MQAQMPNAQGIMGLASQGRMPQGAPQGAPQLPKPPGPQGAAPQMPGPQSGGPMAGLGSVQDRVDAYRSNPAPLQQRYAISQDLKDLLALQTIKSEKEAAAREIELKLAQQQAAQGGELPTIAQQREQEVLELTKNELAQQRGDTADQQVAQQQGAMQKMLSGIAAAPGAGAAAQPKLMATGGIVAFNGEEDGSYVPAPVEAGGAGPYAIEERLARERRRRKLEAERAAAMREVAEAGVPPAPRRPVMPGDPRILGATPPEETVGAPAADFDQRAKLPMTPDMAPPRAEKLPVLAGAATPQKQLLAAPAGPGLPSALPPAPPAPPAPAAPAPVNPSEGLGAALRAKNEELLKTNPEAIEQRRRKATEDALMFPEEQARRRKFIDEQRRLYEQEFDPERQREERLIRFLIGAGGRRGADVLGGGAQASMALAAEQRKARLERLKGMEDMEQGLFGLKQGAVKAGLESGVKGYEQGSQDRRTGLTAGTDIYGQDTRAKDEALGRISRENIANLDRASRERIAATEAEARKIAAQLQAEANRVAKEGQADSRAMSAFTMAQKHLHKVESDAREVLENAIGMLRTKKSHGKELTPQEKQQYDDATNEFNLRVATARKTLEPVLKAAQSRFGVGVDTLSKEERALIDKNLNKGK